MISAKEAHGLISKEKIRATPSLIIIEVKIRTACNNGENKCIIKDDEMTGKAYTILVMEGYQIKRIATDLTYEIYW